jgi:hypothetical protein
MSSTDEILADYEGLRAVQEAFYQDLHRHLGYGARAADYETVGGACSPRLQPSWATASTR